jgi:hypothetical protein
MNNKKNKELKRLTEGMKTDDPFPKKADFFIP